MTARIVAAAVCRTAGVLFGVLLALLAVAGVVLAAAGGSWTWAANALLAVMTFVVVLVRWDRGRRRPRWVWDTDRDRELRAWSRRCRWTARLLVLAVAAGVVAIGGAAAAPLARADDCPLVPAPDRPAQGLAGSLDAGQAIPGKQGSAGKPYEPTADGKGIHGTRYSDLKEVATAYGDYGFAGQVWFTYDLGCMIGEPLNEFTTWAANQIFNVAKDLTAAMNGLHYLVGEVGALGWLDGLVGDLSRPMFHGVLGVWAPLLLLGVAAVLFWHGRKGDNSGAAKTISWAMVGFWVAASAALAPVFWNGFLRDSLTVLTDAAQAGVVSIAAGQRPADAIPDAVSKHVIYRAWIEGEFVDPKSELALHEGPKLLNAQACTKTELQSGACDNKDVLAKKKESWEQVQGEIAKDENGGKNGPNRQLFQGRNGGVRLGAAVNALIQAGWIALFQVAVSAVHFMAFLMFAMLILLLPLVGLLGMLSPDMLRNAVRAFLNMAFAAILMAALGGLHSSAVLAITTNPALPWLVQGIVLMVVTFGFFWIGKPIARTKTALTAVADLVSIDKTSGAGGVGKIPRPRRARAARTDRAGDEGESRRERGPLGREESSGLFGPSGPTELAESRVATPGRFTVPPNPFAAASGGAAAGGAGAGAAGAAGAGGAASRAGAGAAGPAGMALLAATVAAGQAWKGVAGDGGDAGGERSPVGWPHDDGNLEGIPPMAVPAGGWRFFDPDRFDAGLDPQVWADGTPVLPEAFWEASPGMDGVWRVEDDHPDPRPPALGPGTQAGSALALGSGENEGGKA